MSDPNSNLSETGREAGKDAKQSAERLAEDARSTAEDLGNQARDEAWSQAERARSGVASEVSGIADALRRAAGEMRSGSPQERTFGQIAEGLADMSETIQDRDVGQLAGDVSDFARRNPIAFLGGAALAGFAATRFVKASARSPRDTRGDGELSSSRSTGTAPVAGGTGTYSGGMPGGTPDNDRTPGPATAPASTTPGTGAAATATPSPTATKTRGDY